MLNYSHILFKQVTAEPVALLFLFTGAASAYAQQFKCPGSNYMRNLLPTPYLNSYNSLNFVLKSDFPVTSGDGVIVLFNLKNEEF